MSWRKLLLALAVLLVLALAGAGAFYLHLTSSGLPRRAGEARLPGLSAPVTVRFDRWGIPQVDAASGRDGSAVLGWLHANDRLTQMELGRRMAAGRLSEVVGEAALRLDRQARTLRLYQAAEGLWESASSETREWLEAYAAGVNAWLAERGGDLPPALELLGVEPEPWRPVDSLAFAVLMARDLSFWQGRPEEERFGWLRAFGPERTRELLDGDLLQFPEEILALAAQEAAEGPAVALPDSEPVVTEPAASSEGPLGSNNWALGASRSRSGSPLVANDPHLPLRLPGFWYQALIRSPDYEVAGMTLPGLPGVVVGRNRHLGWALTNTMLDDHDLFFEELDSEGRRVRRGEGWAEVTVERVEIPVRGGEAVALELRSTDRGPLLPAEPDRGLPARSLAWTAYLPADPLSAFLGLARSRRVEEVPEAVAGYVVPAQNLVVADESGGLLYLMLGRVPRRLRGDGRLPSPGWSPEYGWDGLRPATANPTLMRPEDDLLVTANDDVRPPGYALPLPADFDTPHRARRIAERLTQNGSWTLPELASVQTDVVSLYARQVVEGAAGDYSGDAALAYDSLEAWNGLMNGGGPAALFALFERDLRRAVFGDEARAHGLRPLDSRARLLRLLAGEMDPAWFDDLSTPEVEDRQAVVAGALAEAWIEGHQRWGDELSEWSYSRIHPLLLAHPVGRLPVLGRRFNRGPFPVPGSASTVAAFGASWRGGVSPVVYGPSMRWLTEVAAPDATLAVLPGGQSGHPWDPHYDDQLPLYLAGELHPVAWSEEAVQAATVSRLTLAP